MTASHEPYYYETLYEHTRDQMPAAAFQRNFLIEPSWKSLSPVDRFTLERMLSLGVLALEGDKHDGTSPVFKDRSLRNLVNMLIVESEWVAAGRPYYDVDPQLVEALLVDEDLREFVSQPDAQLPFTFPLCVRFPFVADGWRSRSPRTLLFAPLLWDHDPDNPPLPRGRPRHDPRREPLTRVGYVGFADLGDEREYSTDLIEGMTCTVPQRYGKSVWFHKPREVLGSLLPGLSLEHSAEFARGVRIWCNLLVAFRGRGKSELARRLVQLPRTPGYGSPLTVPHGHLGESLE